MINGSHVKQLTVDNRSVEKASFNDDWFVSVYLRRFLFMVEANECYVLNTITNWFGVDCNESILSLNVVKSQLFSLRSTAKDNDLYAFQNVT